MKQNRKWVFLKTILTIFTFYPPNQSKLDITARNSTLCHNIDSGNSTYTRHGIQYLTEVHPNYNDIRAKKLYFGLLRTTRLRVD